MSRKPTRQRHYRPAPPATLAACPLCDCLQNVPPLLPGDEARCARCRHVLHARPRHRAEVWEALVLTAIILWILANTTPLMVIAAGGLTSSTTIGGGALAMWREGEQVTAVVVAFCAFAAPGGFLLSLLIVMWGARRQTLSPHLSEVLRWAHYLRVWSLHEVMMVGILVALIKIADVAQVEVGIGLLSVAGLVLLFPLIGLNFDDAELWRRIEWVSPTPGTAEAPPA